MYLTISLPFFQNHITSFIGESLSNTCSPFLKCISQTFICIFFCQLWATISFSCMKFNFSISTFNKSVPQGLSSNASNHPKKDLYLLPYKAIDVAIFILEICSYVQTCTIVKMVPMLAKVHCTHLKYVFWLMDYPLRLHISMRIKIWY